MVFKLSSRDISGFKLLFSLAIMYGLMSLLVYDIIHMKFVRPLDLNAPIHRFSEARAVEHVRVLAQDGRQEGRPGLRLAADYIKSELETIKERAGPGFRIEIEEDAVNGSFSMMFLGHSIALGYRNHTNIAMRISSVHSQDTDASVLINGHFDSPLGSPGAGDCGSCVASMIELARVIVDSDWNPPKPIIFLFNGAEELFMLGAHGFMNLHRWRDSIGASINVEASGSGGPDLVCQSGPGHWPSQVYAQSAVYPMAHSAAQDVFPIIPGDTDYRIFAQDYGRIPSLDIIFLLGGYYYHTSFDTPDKLLPGSMQARGENLLSILKAFTNSIDLSNPQGRESSKALGGFHKDDRAVFFDYLSMFMIFYSKKVAVVFHSIPIAISLLVPFFIHYPDFGWHSLFASYFDHLKGMLFHALAIILAVIFPIFLSIIQLLFSSHSMIWFARPYLAFAMFVPSALVGLLIPRTIWSCLPHSEDVSVTRKSKKLMPDEAWFWGAFGFYACLTLAYLVAELGGGFLTFFVSASMLPAWILFCLSVKFYGRQSVRTMILYLLPLIPCLTYCVYFGGFLAQFLIEKMGMMGSVQPPYGYFLPDIIVATVIGVITGWCVGPLIPVFSHWLARSSILQFLLHVSIVALALSSQFFPYSNSAPKRLVFQHTITTDANRVVDCSYDFSVVDSNTLAFVFKYAPEVAEELDITSDLSLETANVSHRENWFALFPVSFMFSQNLKFPARSDDIVKHYAHFPHLSSYKPNTNLSDGSRRVYLELSLGDLEEVWVAVLNVTGPLSNWSFADGTVTAPETIDGGPPSYICRLSGSSHEKWIFWLEATSAEGLRVEVAVVDQYLADRTKKLKNLFPNWIDVTTYSSFLSHYTF